MATFSVSSPIATHLNSVEGLTTDDKLLSLLETYLTVQLRACEQEISAYEVKYRCTFAEFASAWDNGQLPEKNSHTVERDYMEWEGLVAEKQRWLQRLRVLPKHKTSTPIP